MSSKYLIVCLVFISIISCDKMTYSKKNGDTLRSGSRKFFFKNGDLKSIDYFSNNNIDSSYFYKKSNLDLIYYYYPKDCVYVKQMRENNTILQEGYKGKGIKVGKWNIFDKDSTLRKVFEYKNIDGKQYTNQGWVFNEKGDTIRNESSYYLISPYPFVEVCNFDV